MWNKRVIKIFQYLTPEKRCALEKLKIGIQSNNIILQNHMVQKSKKKIFLSLTHKAWTIQMIANNIMDIKSAFKALA